MIHSIDIFCHVVDNFGDIGIVYRFVRELRLRIPDCVTRVFIDDLITFHAIEPLVDPALTHQEISSVLYIRTDSIDNTFVDRHGSAQIVIEAFGCNIPDAYMDKACHTSKLWINLEHLSGETWVPEYHCTESIQGKGTIRKFFFMPGFTTDTGGVIIDSFIRAARHDLQRYRRQCLDLICKPFSLDFQTVSASRIGTLFSYQKEFSPLLNDLAADDRISHLFVFGEKSTESITTALTSMDATESAPDHWILGNAHILLAPFLSQSQYDLLLCFCDFNIVRGEDSLARAILAGKPFIWHAYIQDKGYQIVKVEALLQRMRPYFNDEAVFEQFRTLMLDFNRPVSVEESITLTGNEQFSGFLAQLGAIERATADMCYFMEQNCSLVDAFIGFAEKSLPS